MLGKDQADTFPLGLFLLLSRHSPSFSSPVVLLPSLLPSFSSPLLFSRHSPPQGLAHAIDAKNPDVQPYTYYFSWGFAVAASAIAYWLICLVFPPRSSFVDYRLYEIDEAVEHSAAVPYAGSGSSQNEEKKDQSSTDVVEV